MAPTTNKERAQKSLAKMKEKLESTIIKEIIPERLAKKMQSGQLDVLPYIFKLDKHEEACEAAGIKYENFKLWYAGGPFKEAVNHILRMKYRNSILILMDQYPKALRVLTDLLDDPDSRIRMQASVILTEKLDKIFEYEAITKKVDELAATVTKAQAAESKSVPPIFLGM